MGRLKLLDEMPTIYQAFEPNKNAIQLYARRLKEQGGYNNFEKRLTWDCLRSFIGTEKICTWYRQYRVNDDHIYSAGKIVLHRLGII